MAEKARLSWLVTLLKAAVSLGILGYIFAGVDFAALWARMDGGVALTALGALALLQLQAMGGALRWTLVLSAHETALAYGAAWRNVLLGLFFNQAMPSTIGGDAARVWNGYRLGLPLGLSTRSIVVDRVCSFLGLIALCAIGLPTLSEQATDPLVVHGLTTLVLGGLGCLLVLLSLRHMPRALATWKGAAPFVALSNSAWLALLSRRTAAPVLALLIAPHLIDITVVWLYARAIGSEATLVQMALVFPPAILVAAVPVSIAGWGLREGALVLGFGVVGLPADQAVAVSLLYGFSAVITGVIGGGLWAWRDPDGMAALWKGRARLDGATTAMPTDGATKAIGPDGAAKAIGPDGAAKAIGPDGAA
ncbi:MAG: flippase-like domain-containing protein [Rhodospirillum sp.]|nr:flippase-like domain-containing protein [Rhodospirillum sp.]